MEVILKRIIGLVLIGLFNSLYIQLCGQDLDLEKSDSGNNTKYEYLFKLSSGIMIDASGGIGIKYSQNEDYQESILNLHYGKGGFLSTNELCGIYYQGNYFGKRMYKGIYGYFQIGLDYIVSRDLINSIIQNGIDVSSIHYRLTGGIGYSYIISEDVCLRIDIGVANRPSLINLSLTIVFLGGSA